MSHSVNVPSDVIAEVEANLDTYECDLIEGLAKSSGQPLPEGWREKHLAELVAARAANRAGEDADG